MYSVVYINAHNEIYERIYTSVADSNLMFENPNIATIKPEDQEKLDKLEVEWVKSFKKMIEFIEKANKKVGITKKIHLHTAPLEVTPS